jgi:hypothetical protein
MSAPDHRAPVHLETERLLMPPVSGRHTGALAEVYADPDVARHIGGATLDADGTAAQVARFEAVWHEPGFGQSALLDRATARSSAGPGCTPGRSGTRSSWASSSPGTRRAGASPRRPRERGWTSRPASSASTASPRSSTPTTQRAGRWSPGWASASTARTSPRPAAGSWSWSTSWFRPADTAGARQAAPPDLDEGRCQRSGRTSRPIARWASGA